MPEGASAQAVDVTKDYADPDDVRADDGSAGTSPEASVIAAYHITITDGEEEYEPDENRPIRVIIADPQISTEGITELWHIRDNGEREPIIDFTLRDGKLSFYAAAFSVYAIVNAPDPYVMADPDSVTSLDDLTGIRADGGFFLYYTTGSSNKYFTNTLNTKGAFIETSDINKASVWFFEHQNGSYQLYTFSDGQKMYLHNSDGNNVELAASGDDFAISDAPKENAFYFKKADQDKWLQHSGSGEGIRYWGDNKNVDNITYNF